MSLPLDPVEDFWAKKGFYIVLPCNQKRIFFLHNQRYELIAVVVVHVVLVVVVVVVTVVVPHGGLLAQVHVVHSVHSSSYY